jgi:outer membrane protein assembly factor BamB
VSDDYWDTLVLTGLDGVLYTVTDDATLYRIDPADGSHGEVGDYGAWARVQAAAAGDGALYLIDAGGLYRTDRETGAYQQVGNEPWSPRALVVVGGAPHVVNEDGTLYRIDPADGAWSEIGTHQAWPGVEAGAAVIGGRIYLVNTELLYAIDPASGTSRRLNDDAWDATHVAACRGRLYVRTADDRLYEVDVG